MDSAGSRALIKKEEKKQEPVFNQHLSVFDRLSTVLQRHILSFLVGNNIKKCKSKSGFPVGPSSQGSFFFEYKTSLIASSAQKAAHNLAHRIKVNETLAFMQKNPTILQSLPFPIEITDPRGGHPIRRDSIIGVLVALDEFDVTEGANGLISTVFSWFNQAKDPRSCHIKNQLQRQLADTSEPRHERATKERNARYRKEIEKLIHDVIRCTDISNDSDEVPFANLLDLKLIQDFIKDAFKPDPKDNGEWGVVWDYWQIYLEYIDLLRTHVNNNNVEEKSSRPNLGSWWSRKTDVVDTAVYMAFMRRSQFCHLEISAKGIGNVSASRPPVRFDCSMDIPNILAGIGSTHFFGFYGDKFMRVPLPGLLGHAAPWSIALPYKSFVKQKHQHYTAYAAATTHQEQLSDNVEIRRSPSAMAAGLSSQHD